MNISKNVNNANLSFTLLQKLQHYNFAISTTRHITSVTNLRFNFKFSLLRIDNLFNLTYHFIIKIINVTSLNTNLIFKSN